MPRASTFGERGHIPLPHPHHPLWPAKLAMCGYAADYYCSKHLTEYPPHENPGYAPLWLQQEKETLQVYWQMQKDQLTTESLCDCVAFVS